MKIPNDLPEGGAAYYQEYIRAGGADHAARAYAQACTQRDLFLGELVKIALGGEGMEEGDNVNVQIMWAVQKSWVEAAKQAEKLRDALPPASAEAADDTGYF